MEDNKRKLYDALSAEYDLGTFEQFSTDIQDADKRKRLYDAIINDYDFGDFDSFSNQLGFGSTQVEQPIDKSQYTLTAEQLGLEDNAYEAMKGLAASPQMGSDTLPTENRNQDIFAGRESMARYADKAQNLRKAKAAYNMNPTAENAEKLDSAARDFSVVETSRLDAEKEKRTREELLAERKRLEDAKREAELRLRTRRSEIASPSGMYQMGMAPVTGNQAAEITDPEMTKLYAAVNSYDNAIRSVDRKLSGEEPGFWEGVADATVRNPGFYTMGLTDMSDARGMLNIAQDSIEGREDELLADAIYSKNAEQQDEDFGFLYRAGNMFGHSVPFMVQTAVTGGFSGASRAGANLAGRLGKKAAEGTIKKKIINAMGTTIDDVIEAGLIANTAGAGGTWANIAERKAGRINIKDGDYVFENGESWLGALYKGEVSSILELYTEKLGGHLEGKLSLTKGLDKIGASRVSNVLLAAKNSDLYKGASTVMRQFGLNGYLPEVLEEEANLVLNSLLVGDNSLSELYNPRTQLDILGGMLLTVGTMQAIPGTIATAGYVKNQYQLNRADRRAADVFGEEWTTMKEALDNATNEDVAGVVSENLRDNGTQDMALLNYYKRMMIMRGYNIGTVKNETAPEVEEAYTDGFSQEPTGANALNAMTGYDIARLEVARAIGLAEGDDVDVFLNGRTAEDVAKGDTDVENAVKNYQLQKARMEGIQEKFQQTREQQYEESDRSIDSNANKANPDMTYSTTYKGEEVFIRNGNVVLNEDGTIDVNNSSESLHVKFPDGHVEMIAPENFSEVFTEDRTEDLKAAKRAEIDERWKAEFDAAEAQSVEQEKRDSGVVFDKADAQGNHRIEILNEGEDMSNILFDGAETEIPTEELNRWKQEAGIQTESAVVDNTTDNVAPTGDNVAPVENNEPAPVELPNVPDFFRLGGRNYEVASRNDDGSVDVMVDGKRETLPAGTDYSTHMPTDKKGEVQYEQMPVERTHEYFVQKVKDDEARAEMIEKRRKKAEAERKKFDKKPDPGIDPDAYEAKMTQWEADKNAAQAKVDYWKEVAKRDAEITRSETREAVNNIKPDVVEETADEFIANQLAGIKITPESFKRETGLSNAEQAQLVGVISNDGVSVERAAEIISENYDSELKALGFTGDMQDVRDIIIDILSQGNPRSYAKKGREAREAENMDQQRADAEAWAKGAFDMKLEELYLYEETILPRIMRDYEGFDENEYYSNLAENNGYDTTRESESTGRGSELLQGEQPVPSGGTPVAGQRNEGGAVSDDVQGGGQNGAAQEEVPVSEPVGNSEQLSSSEIPNNPTISQTNDQVGDQVAEGDAPGQSGVYSLSELTDNEGNRFYQKNGSIDLWDLSPLFAQARRQNAPIRLTERNIDHILDEHKKELGDSEESVLKFLDDVFSTAKVLRKARSGGIFVVVENTKTDKAAIIRLYPSKYGDYYNVESAGYYRKNKWKDTENVIAELSEPTQSVTASDVSKPQVPEEGGKELLNAETATTSASEDINSVSNSQENTQKSGEIVENGGEKKSSIIEEAEAEYRNNPLHGVQFSIDADAYNNEDVTFGESEQSTEGGALVSYQDVIYNGQTIGWVKETQSGRMFAPMVTSFYVPLENATEEDKRSPHYFEGEEDYMRFATLQQMVDYINSKPQQGEIQEPRSVEENLDNGDLESQDDIEEVVSVDYAIFSDMPEKTQAPAVDVKINGKIETRAVELSVPIAEHLIRGNTAGQPSLAEYYDEAFSDEELNALGVDKETLPEPGDHRVLWYSNNAIYIDFNGGAYPIPAIGIKEFIDKRINEGKYIGIYKKGKHAVINTQRSTSEIQEPVSVEDIRPNGDKRITNYNSRGEVATVAIERDGKVVSVDSYDEGVLFEHTEYDTNGKAASVTRYDKQGNVVGTQVYEDGKAKTPMQKLADRILDRTEEKRRIPLRERARELEAQVGVKANIIESIDEVKNREARERIAAGEAVAGWYSGGQVYLYMPNIKDRREIELTYVHEVVAHHGVKKLLGERFNEFLDGVWNMMSEADRARMLAYVGANENPTLQDMRAAADEYVAELAEKMNLGELEQSTWDKIVDWFKELLENIGFENLTKEDIESMLKASYANLRGTEQSTESTENDFRARMTFHGSGAQFDRFDHAFIGSGEGPQAFGWGTYVTEVEGVGRHYANTVTANRGAHITYDGQIFADVIDGMGHWWKIHKASLLSSENIEELKDKIQRMRVGDLVPSHRAEKFERQKNEILNAINNGKIKVGKSRHLYSVEIPDDNGSNYLHWEDVVPDEVIDNLWDKLRNTYGEDVALNVSPKYGQDGEHLYKKLSRGIGGDKQASLFLSDMGFVGISYPVEATTGGRADGARNYVIFNENDAQIKDRTMFRKKDSERRQEKRRINDAIDTAAGFITVGGKKQATKNRLKKEAERKQLAKEIYSSVLKGNFNDVTLSQIDKFIEDATPANPFGRRISQRLPQRMERALRQGARTNAVDALFSRISESAVPANERFSEAGRREIEERKKELLKGWAIATGNWHTDLKEFTDDTEPIGEGKDSKVYSSKDGRYVIKASKGKPYGKRFRPDIDNIALFNDVFRDTRYEILGYGEIDGEFVRILQQPIVDFAQSTPLTSEERREYMQSLGFEPLNDANTAFADGEIVIADLQKGNVVRDAAGNISVIDADAKLHTKDVGGDYTYPPVEEDLPEESGTRFRKVENTENNSIFASTYKTEDGKDINYTSERAEGYGVQDDGIGNSNSGSRRSILQRQTDTGVPGADSGLDAEKGEFCVVERVFTENGAFNFTSGEKIESADDVAYIFSALEDAAKEHSFVVYVKDGMPTVVELGMGSFNATMVDVPTASLAYSRINPDHVYFVHNHPSGNLICSSQDVAMLRVFEDMSDVPVTGVIINLKTGKYGTFDTERHSVIGEKRVPEKEVKLAVHTLDKQIFAPDYDPMAQPLVRGSQDVAQFLNSQRMGDRPKVSFLILSRANRIIGNIHTPFTNITTDVEAVARYINERVIQFGGENAILYGDFAITSVEGMDFRLLQNAMDRFGKTKLLDVVRVEGNFTRSANDMGLLYEPEAEYKDGQTMFRFIGERGAANLDRAEEATTRLDNLAVAREMETAGKDATAIKLATGWERGADGKWRYETEDFDIKDNKIDYITNQLDNNRDAVIMLYDLVENAEGLFAAYPDLLKLRVRVRRDGSVIPQGELQWNEEAYDRQIVINEASIISHFAKSALERYGKADIGLIRIKQGYDPVTKEKFANDVERKEAADIYVEMINDALLDYERYKKRDIGIATGILGHEVQYAIQFMEGFAIGSNAEMFENKRGKVLDDLNFVTSGDVLRGSAISDVQSLRDALDKNIPYTEVSVKEGYAENLQKVARKYGYENIDALVEDFTNMPSAFEQYRRTAGEVESRNVQGRMNMTTEERRASLAAETEDVARKDQIFIYEALESVMQGQTMFRIADDVITTVDDFNSTHKGAAPTVIIDSADTLEEQLRAEGFSKEDIAESLKDYDSEFAYYHPTYDKVVINDHDVPKDELIGYLWHENAHRAVRELYTREDMERLCDYIYKDDMPRVREVLSEMGYKPEELAEEAYVRGIEDVFSKKDYRRRLERGGLKPKEDATEEEKVIIDSVNRIVDFINNGREEERADGRRAGGGYAERSTQENRRGQDEEVRNSQETGENTQAGDTRFRTVEETTDGSIDDVPAQPLTLMERIANSLLEVSAKNKENLELRASALRTFGRDINRVLSLMKAQREYDKSTVDTLVKLAKMYFKNAQLLGEVDTYTMGRVLSLINNVVGKRDVTASAAKLMDILLDAHTKALAGILDKAEKGNNTTAHAIAYG